MVDCTQTEWGELKKEATRMRRLADKTQNMGAKLIKMATNLGIKAAKMEEQATEML